MNQRELLSLLRAATLSIAVLALFYLAIASALPGCVTLTPASPGLTLICHTKIDPCPTRSEITEAMELFRDTTASIFDVDDHLEVNWYDKDTVWLGIVEGRLAIGYTDNPHVVHVTSMRNLIHELMHVHLWRMFPESNGDPTHAEPPGPWTEETSRAVQRVIKAGGYDR